MRGGWHTVELRARAALAVLIIVTGFGIANELAPAVARPAVTLSDGASLLDADQRASIEAQHRLLLADHGVDYRVETVLGVEQLDALATRRFRELAMSSTSGAKRTLLLVVDAADGEVQLEVGSALTATFPPEFVANVEQRQLTPFVRTGRMDEGVLAATELVVARVQGVRTSVAWGTAGAGESNAARPATTPEGTVRAYLDAMRARNTSPDLELYTLATRDLLRTRVLGATQMDAISSSYRACHPEPARISGSLAVIRYARKERVCAPFLLLFQDGRWRLDLETASHVIRFGRASAWRMEHPTTSPYAFAFADWKFDANGFPIDPETDT